LAITSVSQVLLTIESAYQEEIITDSGLKLFLDPTYRKEHNVSVTAKIAALPSNPNPKDKYILNQLKVGDEVAISYSVVADFTFQGDGHRYMLTTEENDTFREYVNGQGYWVKVYAMNGPSGLIWVGVHQDKYMNVIDGTQGDQSKIETWLSQFPLGKTDLYSFNNFFEYKSKDYWKCSLQDIYAKKVKGHLVAVGNRVIGKPIDQYVPHPDLVGVNIPNVKLRFHDRFRVISGGKEKGIKKDDVVGFNPNHLEKYEFWNKQYYIINQNLVLGKWQ